MEKGRAILSSRRHVKHDFQDILLRLRLSPKNQERHQVSKSEKVMYTRHSQSGAVSSRRSTEVLKISVQLTFGNKSRIPTSMESVTPHAVYRRCFRLLGCSPFLQDQFVCMTCMHDALLHPCICKLFLPHYSWPIVLGPLFLAHCFLPIMLGVHFPGSTFLC